MKRFLLLLFTASILFISCGSNPENEVNDMLTNKQYLAAAKKFKKMAKENPEKVNYYQSMAMYAQLKNGNTIYSRLVKAKPISAINAYITNYEKAENEKPENIDPQAKPKIIDALVEFAEALYNTKPKNDVQASKFEDLMFQAVDEASTLDPANQKVKAFKESVFKDKFNDAVAKGDKFMTDAKKQRDDYSYLLAEKAYAYALKFFPDNSDVQKKLSKVRKITLAIWNPDDLLLMAISGVKHIKEVDHYAFGISLKNNTDMDYQFDPANFTLILKDGTELAWDPAVNKEYDQAFKARKLKRYKEVDGIAAFKYKGKEADFEKLVYHYNDDTDIVKFFP